MSKKLKKHLEACKKRLEAEIKLAVATRIGKVIAPINLKEELAKKWKARRLRVELWR